VAILSEERKMMMLWSFGGEDEDQRGIETERDRNREGERGEGSNFAGSRGEETRVRLLAMSYGALHCTVKLTYTAAANPGADGAAVVAAANLGAALHFGAQADQLRAGAFH
jgi:hypothetical protein